RRDRSAAKRLRPQKVAARCRWGQHRAHGDECSDTNNSLLNYVQRDREADRLDAVGLSLLVRSARSVRGAFRRRAASVLEYRFVKTGEAVSKLLGDRFFHGSKKCSGGGSAQTAAADDAVVACCGHCRRRRSDL